LCVHLRKRGRKCGSQNHSQKKREKENGSVRAGGLRGEEKQRMGTSVKAGGGGGPSEKTQGEERAGGVAPFAKPTKRDNETRT